jgi:hypothetical protein
VGSADDDADEVPEDYAPAIIAESTKQLVTMSVANAVMALDMTDERIFMFRNAGNDALNVVYRRDDGTYRVDRRRRGQVLTALADMILRQAGWRPMEPRRPAAVHMMRTMRSGKRTRNKEFIMALADLIAQNSVLPALKANSKKQLLQELAAKASEVTGLAEREVFDVILQRERLGSTGVGNGIAIPHGKLASLDKIVGVFARLDQPVDFEALDDQPSIWCSCCSPPKAPVPITSRRFRALPV